MISSRRYSIRSWEQRAGSKLYFYTSANYFSACLLSQILILIRKLIERRVPYELLTMFFDYYFTIITMVLRKREIFVLKLSTSSDDYYWWMFCLDENVIMILKKRSILWNIFQHIGYSKRTHIHTHTHAWHRVGIRDWCIWLLRKASMWFWSFSRFGMARGITRSPTGWEKKFVIAWALQTFQSTPRR